MARLYTLGMSVSKRSAKLQPKAKPHEDSEVGLRTIESTAGKDSHILPACETPGALGKTDVVWRTSTRPNLHFPKGKAQTPPCDYPALYRAFWESPAKLDLDLDLKSQSDAKFDPLICKIREILRENWEGYMVDDNDGFGSFGETYPGEGDDPNEAEEKNIPTIGDLLGLMLPHIGQRQLGALVQTPCESYGLLQSCWWSFFIEPIIRVTITHPHARKECVAKLVNRFPEIILPSGFADLGYHPLYNFLAVYFFHTALKELGFGAQARHYAGLLDCATAPSLQRFLSCSATPLVLGELMERSAVQQDPPKIPVVHISKDYLKVWLPGTPTSEKPSAEHFKKCNSTKLLEELHKKWVAFHSKKSETSEIELSGEMRLGFGLARDYRSSAFLPLIKGQGSIKIIEETKPGKLDTKIRLSENYTYTII